LTFVMNSFLADAGAFGMKVDKNGVGENIKNEIGSSVAIVFKKELMKNILLETQLNLFESYKTLTRVDLDWETQFNLKVNRFVFANISTHFLYDHDQKVPKKNKSGMILQGRGGQFKEVLGIGISIHF